VDYRVELDVYNGPLDLLLYLIKRDELDIYDIPIARITDSYMHYVSMLKELGEGDLDINLAGEFLVMAATLMEIKSRMLIPRIPAQGDSAEGAPASVEELTDPRYELVKQLLAYKAFKDAAGNLKRRADTEAARYPRAVPKREGRAPLAIEDLDLFRLIDAFNAIMASVGHSAYGHEVVYDDTPISLHQADILDRLERDGGGIGGPGLTLQELFAGRSKKSEMIGLFLATLELIRQKKIAVEQTQTLGEIRIRAREPDEEVLFAPGAESSPEAPPSQSSQHQAPHPIPHDHQEQPPEDRPLPQTPRHQPISSGSGAGENQSDRQEHQQERIVQNTSEEEHHPQHQPMSDRPGHHP
jgi:segregation and condensation protein A